MSVSFGLKRQIKWFRHKNVESRAALQKALKSLSPAEIEQVQQLLVKLENQSKLMTAAMMSTAFVVALVTKGDFVLVSLGAALGSAFAHGGNMDKYEAIQRLIETKD